MPNNEDFKSSSSYSQDYLELKEITSDVKTSNSNSSDILYPSERDIKDPNAATPDYNYIDSCLHVLKSLRIVINFEEKAFEDHLNAATLHLKDDFSFSSTSRASSVSEFSSFVRLDSAINSATMILDKEIETLNFDSKNIASVPDRTSPIDSSM